MSNYFTPNELRCRCGCGTEPNLGFVVLLNRIREDFGEPINVTNVARCQHHNDTIKPPGAKNSAHVAGVAADLVRTPDLFEFIMTNLERYNIYVEDPEQTPTWIHIQTRPVPSGSRVFKINTSKLPEGPSKGEISQKLKDVEKQIL